jgi:predicted ATPase
MRVLRGAWPLVGRNEELAAILEAIGAAERIGVVVAGEAGVGKTRLAREALAMARARGLATRWAVATQAAATIPLGGVHPMLRTTSAGLVTMRRRRPFSWRRYE